MMLVVFAIYQIIIFYVLMFIEKLRLFCVDLFVLFACLLKNVEIIMFGLSCMFTEN
jgi:hypothetical protein